MGVSYSSNLCVGVKMSKVFEIKNKTVLKTKYNPDTGVPYESKLIEKELLFFGKVIEEPVKYYPGEWALQL